MSILESVEKIDRDLFVLINRDGNIYFLDSLMLALRNPLTWIPLYIFILWWSITRLKKKASVFLFFSILTIAITDPLAASVFKPFFERLRPCAEPSLAGIVHILEGCGGKYSFPSNHAANHFGLAAFWFVSIRRMSDQNWWWLWVWAFVICYAQVYVGKHYPGDILGGAFLGISIGMINYQAFKWLLDKSQKKSDPHTPV